MPLGEDSEHYTIDILSGSSVVRTLTATSPSVLYAAADELADFGTAQPSLTVRVAQVSATVGTGYAAQATLALQKASMTDTPRLSLPVIEAAQAQKHVTHNQALVLLDALTQLAVESRSLSVPPGSPADGACYIVASGATGVWSGRDGSIAQYSGGGWQRLVPVPGLKAWVRDQRATLTYEDGVWSDGIALTANGGRVTLRAKEEELTLTGAYVETADAAFIPDRAVVFGVSVRTTLAITGATSYGVGVAADATQFGDLIGIALGSSNIGAIGPAGFYADTKVRVTANGGGFTAGKVRLVVYFLEMSAPTA